jgi:transcriptional regulator with XRE-family HTH domain
MARKLLGLTQPQMAKLLGVTVLTISLLENGHTTGWTKKFRKLVSALKKS